MPNPLTMEAIREMVGRDDPIILEIGANNGKTTAQFLATFPQGRLYCFEPDWRAIKKWRRGIKDNPRATLFEMAVGAVDGTVTFHESAGMENSGYPDGYDQSGSLRPPKTHLERWPHVEFRKTVEVECVRLDTWLASHPLERIDFQWVDVQGAERDLIAGAEKALSITRYFFTEYSNDEWYEGQANLDTLKSMLPDFEMQQRFKSDVLFRRKS
jgi:FkbM family methyltransferase